MGPSSRPKLRRVQDLDVRHRRVLVRVDFNVPLKAGRVLDDGRLRAALPTIRYLLEKDAVVLLLSHLGRPKGRVDEALRLAPVAERLAELLDRPVRALDGCVGEAVREQISSLKPGQVILLENVRFHPEETQNDPGFAQALSELADLYVNDAFGTAHRAHASTHAVAKRLPAAAGLLVQREVEALSRLLESPERPFLALVGGVKAAEKVGKLAGLLGRVDEFLIGGGVAFTFLAAQGRAIGRSAFAPEYVEAARRFVKEAYAHGAEVLLPVDVQAAEALEPGSRPAIVSTQAIPPGMMGLDIGPRTTKDFRRRIRQAKTLFWAGPLGAFETPPFDKGTRELAKAVVESPAFSVIGGGETGAAFSRLGADIELPDHVFVSTGGGAALAFVAGESLPGLEVLRA